MIEVMSQTKDVTLDVSAAQRKASDPQTSVWVGASAGSGKTKVLADRVSRLLLDDVRPERILCLTFTRAAAAEMAIRMTQRLSRWATCDDAVLEKELTDLQGFAPKEKQNGQKQRDKARRLFAQVLSCAGGMRIQTIHAFAQEILRRFPLEAGLAPHFTVMEEADARALWDEALDDVLEHVAEHKDKPLAQAFALLVSSLGESSLRGILHEAGSQAQKLRATMAKAGGLEALVQALRTRLDLEPQDSAAFFKSAAVREDYFDRAGLLNAACLLLDKSTPSFKKRGQTMCDWLAQDEAGRLATMEGYARAFLTTTGEPFAKVADKALLDDHPEIEDALRVEAQRLLNLAERLDTVRSAEETAAVLAFSMAVIEAYEGRKHARAVLDYDDLIAKTNALLARDAIAPWVLYKLDGGIDHILVDESQDTNPSQWRIIETLANEYFSGEGAFEDRSRTLFVVGDEKQSIYSFLKADPEEFARMRRHFDERIRQANKPFAEVPLNVSFRSAPAILRAVDAVFEKDEVRAGVSRDPVAHSAFRETGAGRVEVWPLCEAPEDAPKKTSSKGAPPADWQMPVGYETAHDPAFALAEQLARQIKRWIVQGRAVFDRALKTERPMNAGDVMVLVQTRGPFVSHFVSALKQLDVPVSGVDRMRLTTQLAVMDLMALLQFALLPQDDLTLACVLRGPLIGASEEQLMELALGRTGSLWQSLCANSAFEKWRDYLASLCDHADQTPPLPLLVRVLSEPCPADARSGRRALAARLGPDAEDPIDELLNEAEAFGAGHTPSLQAFLHWLMSADAEIKREMDQAASRVRITTVHASKGLESPIVILPDTVRVPEKQKLPKILWDAVLSERGVAAGDVPFYVPRDPSNMRLKTLRQAAHSKQMEEYRRLLYVAMTRAADRLYVCGFVKDKNDEAKDNWYNLIARGLDAHHQDEAAEVAAGDVMPSLVLADYALRRHCEEAASPTWQSSPPLSTSDPSRSSGLDCHAPEEGARNDDALKVPPWLFAPPPPEPSPPRPLVPSRPSEEDPPTISPQDRRFARGKIIHRLLQSLPEVDVERRKEAAQRFLANPQHGLDSSAQNEICAEVLDLIGDPRFAPLFGSDSRAEQPIIGLSGERLIAGQVDRLALVDGEVWIVDYKTNRPPPSDAANIPSVYRGQMEAYRTVLQAIYPIRKVRCFLLWTYTLALMEL